MEIESNLGKSPKASFERAQAACDGALVANPESSAAHGKKAWALWQYGGYLLWTAGKDPTDVLSKAIEAGKTAVRLDPADANTFDTIGIAHVYLALYGIRRGTDPRPSFQRAAENLERAIELHPNFAWAYNDLGGVHRDTAEYELSRGVDPTSSLKKSIAYTEKAIELNPSYHYPYTNIGIAHVLKAQYELRNGRDPMEPIRLAIAICERSLGVNKAYFVTYHTLGTAYRTEARYRLYRGEAFDDSIQKALGWFQEELEVNPTSYYAHLEIASLHLLVAHELFKSEQDPSVPLAKAESALLEMGKTGGDDVQTPLTRARILLLKARMAAKSSKKKEDVELAWQQAEETLTSTLKVGVGVWEVLATGAEMSFWGARGARRSKKPAAELIKEGITMADEGLAISADEPVLLMWKGGLLLVSSRVEGGPGNNDAAHRGKILVDKALQKNPFLAREWKVAESELEKD
jgi:tetratricopeptide (TPR) repeat protein